LIDTSSYLLLLPLMLININNIYLYGIFLPKRYENKNLVKKRVLKEVIFDERKRFDG